MGVPRVACLVLSSALATSLADAEEAASGEAPAATASPTTDGPVSHPIFAVANVTGEVGSYYLSGARIGLLGNPARSGISLGGSLFVAPITNLTVTCGSCKVNPIVWRGTIDLRLGSAYRETARGLAWLGVSAGATYLGEPGVELSPVVSVAGGGDLRLASVVWFEIALRGTWAQVLAPGSSLAAPYISFGLDVGARLDLFVVR